VVSTLVDAEFIMISFFGKTIGRPYWLRCRNYEVDWKELSAHLATRGLFSLPLWPLFAPVIGSVPSSWQI
jgi:hypothetical protein